MNKDRCGTCSHWEFMKATVDRKDAAVDVGLCRKLVAEYRNGEDAARLIDRPLDRPLQPIQTPLVTQSSFSCSFYRRM